MVLAEIPATQTQVALRTGNRNGALGLGSALGFLVFISLKFRLVQRHNKVAAEVEHGLTEQAGLLQSMGGILGHACSFREALTVTRLSLMLLLRTVGSIWVSRHWGKIVKSVVLLNFSSLFALVSEFAGATLLLSLLNALLKYYISLLKLQVREKITRWCHEVYMRPGDMTYYKANRVGDHKIKHTDHQITSDVERFSDSCADVLSQSLKPLADFLLYSVELSRVQGLATPLTLYGWYAFAISTSGLVLPAFGEHTAKEQQLEGEFRGKHNELITNCEQVAFLGGERQERKVLDRQLDQMLDHYRSTINECFNFEIIRQYLNKYFVTVIGLFLVSRPLRLDMSGAQKTSPDELARYFTATWRDMEALSMSIKDLFDLTNHLGRLSGLSTRVHSLMSALEVVPPVLVTEIDQARRGPHPPSFKDGSDLRFQHVSIYKPDGTLLVKDLNLTIERGQRILVTGGNGCGKSSLFRVIRELWPLVEGTITRPAEKDIHYLPQVSFIPSGTLRDLVIYPDSLEEMQMQRRTDEDIWRCLRWAHVSPKIVKHGRAQLEFTDGRWIVRPDLDDIRDWQKDLSPGQKQRLAFARLFYHRPSFVVLDECTNGVSPDVEHDLYDRCKRMNLAVLSISHRIELRLFHDYELHYTGDVDGSWSLTQCSETTDKVTRSSAMVKLPEPDKTGKTETRITYERHIWFAD